MHDDQQPSNDSAESDKNEMQRPRKGIINRSIPLLKRRTILKGLGAGVGLGATGGFAIGTASASGFDEQVEIDIKPGSDPNAINCKKRGGTPVAVLSTDDFDATTVDPSSLRFGKPRVVAEGGGARLSHKGGHQEDIDGDGDTDFVGHFPTRDAGFTAEDTVGWLVGETKGGQRFVGIDSVKTVGRCPEDEEGLPQAGLGTVVTQSTDDVPEPGPVPEEPEEKREKELEDEEFQKLKEQAENGELQQPPRENVQREGGDSEGASIQSHTQEIVVGEGFPAWDNKETGSNPPDPTIAAGPGDNLVSAVNVRWGIFDKITGNMKFEVTFLDWFDPVLDTTPTNISDPKVLYDHHAERYVVMIWARNDNEQTASWLVAVSEDSNPFGTWYLTKIPHDRDTEWIDWPGLGVDENGIYLTGNMFKFFGSFRFAKIVTIDKTPLYNGNSYTYWWFNDVKDHNGDQAHTIKPTHDMPSTAEGGSQWLVSSNRVKGSSLTLYELQNPTSRPRLFTNKVDVPEYSVPPKAEQPNTDKKLSTYDARLGNAVFENGSVWTVHAIGFDWNDDDDASCLLKWYEIDVNSSSLEQDRGWGRPNGDYFFPSVASNGISTMIVYAESGPETNPRIEVVGRTVDAPQNELQDVAVIRFGESEFIPFKGDTARWGDYSGIVVNPGEEGEDYFMFHEYSHKANEKSRWETWVGSASLDMELF